MTNQQGAPEAPKSTALDGKTELFHVSGYPLLVRAVDFNRLYAAPPAPTEQQIGALQAELAGNEAATMHLSRMVDELRALLCQAMRVMKDLHESATPDESREDCPPIIPTSDFAKFVNDNAALMYAIKQCGHDAAPPQGAANKDES